MHMRTGSAAQLGCRPRLPVMNTQRALERIKANSRVEPTGCWQWTGYRRPPQGYGETTLNSEKWAAHRLSYTVHKGPIPEGQFVCHTCDNPACVNPDHLWVGTHQDNMKDAKAKKRIARAYRTHCPRGHSYADHAVIYGNQTTRHCAMCELGKHRIKTGWPADLAYSQPAGAPGYRPPEAGTPIPKQRTPRSTTHCMRGHEFTPKNTYIYPSNGRRSCRQCASDRHKRPSGTPDGGRS